LKYAVYIIGPISGFPCKVGVASKLKQRLAGLQVSHWEELFIHHAILVKCSKIDNEDMRPKSLAFKIERILMNRLKEYHIRGEWYNILAADAFKELNEIFNEIEVSLNIKGNQRYTPGPPKMLQ
jgi:hypothetical protein